MSKNSKAKYYQENKERLQIKARERYQNLFKGEKKIATICSTNLQKSLRSEKHKLAEYIKNFTECEIIGWNFLRKYKNFF